MNFGFYLMHKKLITFQPFQLKRQVNIPAIGFSPILRTPDLAHENDEFIAADEYLRGIDAYKTVLLRIANIL